MESRNCVQAQDSLIEFGEAGDIPWVLLRPRPINGATAFDGDFDFFIDDTRFGEILHAVFYSRQSAGVSFVLSQVSAFMRQIDLLDGNGPNRDIGAVVPCSISHLERPRLLHSRRRRLPDL